MRDVALIRGAIINAMVSAVTASAGNGNVICSNAREDRRHNNVRRPMRWVLRITIRPYFTNVRFSPTSGTMSATDAIATISKSHFSHPSGISSRFAFSDRISAHATLNVTPAAHNVLKGYGSPSRLGSMIAYAAGGIGGTK